MTSFSNPPSASAVNNAARTPRGLRVVITLVGRTNTGKSSLINALTEQQISIVSTLSGTTTDAVSKPYELPPIGPVTLYDTAGFDDAGPLGAQRMAATRSVLLRTDIALLVVGEAGIQQQEKILLEELRGMGIPVVVAFNKTDIYTPGAADITACTPFHHVLISAASGTGIAELKRLLAASQTTGNALACHAGAPAEPVLVADLIHEGDTVLCVVPLDLAAPKGRLILPQVQVLRDILDADALGMVVKERELEQALKTLRVPPALVITDSQVVLKVAGDVPTSVPMTTFSTLLARFKGDLPTLVQGAQAIDLLKDGDRILLCEACSHHAVADDIGRVKIPRWLTQYTGKELHFDMYAGHDFPDNLEDYALAIHCGGCMTNRTEMLRRIRECTLRGVPITNYGVAISKVQGVLERVIAPFGLVGLNG